MEMATKALALALCAASYATLGATATPPSDAPYIDAQGLEFVSQEAFCRFHCSAAHVARAYRQLQASSECEEAKCETFTTTTRQRRQLGELQQSYSFGNDGSAGASSVVAEVSASPGAYSSQFVGSEEVSASASDASAGYSTDDGKNVETVDFVSCQKLPGARSVRQGVSLTVGDSKQNAFAGFHDAFFEAYDAMISSANATYDACKLQFVQDELLSNYTATTTSTPSSSSIQPMLVRLDPSHNELSCIQSIRDVWSLDDESFTPFLTRSDMDNADATVMLLHLPKKPAEKIADLDCISSVVQLPAVLKLTPFARASVSLAKSTTLVGGPSLEIRLVKGFAASNVAARLQNELKAVTGIQNIISYREDDATTRVLALQALDDYSTWTKAVAVILEDDAVEWVDLKSSLSTGSLKPHSSFEQLLESSAEFSSSRKLREVEQRRLDDYVQDLVGATAVREKNITGNGIVVGVTDTGLYVYHDQFMQTSTDMYDQANLKARKVVLYKTFGNNHDESEQVTCGHGTHVSGILAGSSSTTGGKDLGIAHSARIAFMDIGKQSSSCMGQSGCEVKLETPGEVDSLMKDQVDAGARIFSFSWGTGGNDYNTQSRDIDNYVYNNPEILIIVAAGNSGDKGSQTISSPSGAKNVISVGASLNDAASFVKTPCSSVLNKQTVASFSSIGPTLDGRMKPDLVAPGMTIESSQSEAPGSTTESSALCSLQGTSQATPVVAGMAVLLYEWLRDGWWKHGVKDAKFGMKTIPAALLKALILHSGEKMSRRLVAPRNGVTSCVAMESSAKALTSYPDFNQGYGKPTMANLVSFKDDVGAGVYFFPNSTEGSEPKVIEGGQSKFTFVLKDGANLRVTLVWTDPAGSVAGKTALQNDLDLSVIIPGTDKVFYPLSGNGTRDSVNNVEMVEVSYDDVIAAMKSQGVKYDESTGVTVEAIVHGKSVKAGTGQGQKFALVASSSPSSVETDAASTSSDATSFWQPWMTVGIVIGGTLMILFAIAVGWRMKARARREDRKLGGGGSPALPVPRRRTSANDDNYHGVARGAVPMTHPPPPMNRPQRAPSNSRQNNHIVRL